LRVADALSARSGGQDEQGMHGIRVYGAMDQLTAAESAWHGRADDFAAMAEAEFAEARQAYERFRTACEAELAAERSARDPAAVIAARSALRQVSHVHLVQE